ncbi:MAG: hypothetical protein K2X82_11530 [Gemmataceae bacterium]|nr:hypothetical protein [Gemmataceae bacterium]
MVAVVICAAAGHQASADDSSDVLLDRVLAAHRAARESIRTLKLSYKLEKQVPDRTIMGAGVYLRSGDVAVLRIERDDGSMSVAQTKNGETRHVSKTLSPGKQARYLASRQSGSQTLGLTDIWQRLMFSHVGLDQQSLPFEQYIRTASGPVRASSTRRDNREVVTVIVPIGVGDTVQERRYEFDSGHNYSIAKHFISFSSSRERSEAEVLGYQDFGSGIFLPTATRMRTYKGDAIEQEWTATFSDVVVNAPLPEGQLALPVIPSGTDLIDRIEHLRYPVDSNWKRTGPAKTFHPIRVEAPAESVAEFHTQTEAEPRPSYHWVIFASVVALATAGVIWGVRRWRAGAETG